MSNISSQFSFVGHLIDIDSSGSLRARRNHRIEWDEQGLIRDIRPSGIELGEDCPVVFPGMVDCHVHFPQTHIIGGYGDDLLDWLDKNVWPEEKRFAQVEYAEQTAQTFLHNLLSNGTTTALVFGSQFKDAMHALFTHADRLGMALITGATLQDQNTIPELEFPPEVLREHIEELILKWHNKGRLRYAITPRFTPACSEELFSVCKELLIKHQDLYFQTHINESPGEIEYVRSLHPDAQDYLATYEKHGFVCERSVFAHSIHPTQSELTRMGAAGCSVAHCPSSNAFLGSGAFSYQHHIEHGIRIGLGSDVGAGTSFSLWDELQHMHFIQMRKDLNERYSVTGESMLRQATLDGAKALRLENEIGNFEVGKWADFFTVLGSGLDRYLEEKEGLSSHLFRLAFCSDMRSVDSTFVRGVRVFSQNG